MNNEHKFVVLDDDPTGVQTVHSCLLLTGWDKELLRQAFKDEARLFFILTNTRALPGAEVQPLIAGIMDNLLTVQRELGTTSTLISRSDSTLRSHFPREVNSIIASLQHHGMPSLDAIFLVPAFFEGGRLTVDDTHYVLEKGQRVPASETEFARDSVFGYNSAHLPTYIEEKTAGKVSAAAVQSISPELLNDGNALDSFLQGLTSSVYVVANAERYDQLHRLTSALRRALAQGKRFLFQSAASLVKSLAEVSDKPLLRGQELGDGGLGLVMVGSHVHKTTRQLDRLLAHEKTVGIEAEVDIIGERYETHLKTVAAALNAAWDTGYTPVVYTSRQEKHIPDADQRQQLGAAVSRFLVDVVRNISQPLAWCIAKGGITSHNILQKGLAVTQARVLGQILPGIPIVRVPRAGLCSGLTYIVFPGNVGDDEALLKVFEALAEDRSGRTR